MTTNLETIKAEYLAEFKQSVPRLKELAKAIRAEDVKLTDDSENTKFWQFTDDPKTNYELCQLATDLEGYDEFWANHPDHQGETSPAPNTQEGDRRYDLPIDTVLSVYRFAEKFKSVFPELKALAQKAYDHPLMKTDQEIDDTLNLLKELLGDMHSDGVQFCHDVITH
jgi:hypothetical protein